MKSPVEKAERVYLRLLVGLIGGAILLILVGWAGMRVYHGWQERHLLRRAAAYLSGGDVKTASLNARRALQLNPESPEVIRQLAEIAQRAGDGTEMQWRRKLFELRPDSIDDALALVRTALRANDLATAERTLHRIAPLGENVAAFHAARGRLAEMRGDRAGAEESWKRATELAPTETAFQMQLAIVQLGNPNESIRANARLVLEKLRTEPKQRTAATRALIMDAASHPGDPQRVRTMAAELQTFPDAVFSDRLLYLEILRQLRAPEFRDYLTGLEAAARGNPSDLGSLISWMVVNFDAREAVQFSEALSLAETAKWPVPLAMAEAYAKEGDWAGLERFASAGNWGGFDFQRRAYRARALRSEEKQTEADREWAEAQREASRQPQAVLLLARTVSAWGWKQETSDLLWTLAKGREMNKEALQELYQQDARDGDTAGLYRVLLRSIELEPDDLKMQNNFAQISLLLDFEAERARKLAATLAQKQPTNPACVSTYAFSLLQRNDVPGALRAIESLTAEQLSAPGIAAYYGMILAAAGEKEKARQSLKRARDAFLLPEEKALVAKAEAMSQ